jgi:histidinol-phosphatase
MPSHTDDLRLAHILADDADSTTMDRYKALDLHVATKPDLTPVSESDKKVEDVMRKTLARARPRDAFVGEEDGTSGAGWSTRSTAPRTTSAACRSGPR